jgi:hypothetical protein
MAISPPVTRTLPRRLTGSDLRAAVLGSYAEGMTVLRQAYRVTEDDSDELDLVAVPSRSEWWVTRRISGRVTVWAASGEDQAHTEFDRLLAEPSPRGRWHEAGTLEQ